MPSTLPTAPSAEPAPLFKPCTDGMRLGLGGAPLGNLFEAVTQEQACALLEAAWADGCRSFDTAPHYGHGLSERRMGLSLWQRPRAELSLSSKVGRLLLPQAQAARAQHGYVEIAPFDQRWDLSAAGMRRSVEDSLQRLGMARLDAVFVHDIDAQTHGADAPRVLSLVLEQSLPALRQLQAEGLVGGIGLGVNDHEVVGQVLVHADLDCLLLAGRYSLLDQSALPRLLPELQRRGVALALGGVFNSGILAKRVDAREQPTFNYAAAQPQWLNKALRIQAVCDRHQVPIAAAALQFALSHPAAQIVLLGARKPSEWQQARANARRPIDPALWHELKQEGLLPQDAPTP
jgi:D-threo-aldose 1-dehydrogenase